MCQAHPFLLSCLLIAESIRASARSLSTFGAVSQAQPVSQRSGLTTVGSSFKGSLSLSAPLVRSLNVVVSQAQPVSQRSGLTTVGSSFKGSLSLLAPLVRSLNVVVSQGVSPVSQRSGLISLVVSPKSVSWCHTHGDRLRIGYLLMWLRPIEECVIESIDSYRCRHLPKQIGNFRPAS